MVTLTLPWPPSVNHYWRKTRSHVYVSPEGVAFRQQTYLLALNDRNRFDSKERLIVSIDAYPPDKRRRDLDNILKCLLDSLQFAAVYDDDSQIDKLSITRMPEKLGQVIITVSSYQGISSSSKGVP